MITATILPVPGRKRRFVDQNCTIENHAYLNIFWSLIAFKDAAERDCSDYIACLEILRIKDELNLLDILLELTHLKLGDCQRLYPECAY